MKKPAQMLKSKKKTNTLLWSLYCTGLGLLQLTKLSSQVRILTYSKAQNSSVVLVLCRLLPILADTISLNALLQKTISDHRAAVTLFKEKEKLIHFS